jgi:hypothetical protein
MFYDEIDTLSDEYIQSMKLDKVKEVYVQYYEIHHQLVNILFADEIYFKDTNQQQSLTKTREVMEEMTEEMHNIQNVLSLLNFQDDRINYFYKLMSSAWSALKKQTIYGL